MLVVRASEDRPQTWFNVTNKISMTMFERLSSYEAEAVSAREEFLREVRAERASLESALATVQKISGTPLASI